MSEKIAEIIESNTRAFVAEVYAGVEAPAFGSWVRVEHDRGFEVYGLVSHVEIGSLEPNRRAMAFGKTTDELRKELPHVLELLRTTFRAQVVVYRDEKNTMRQTLPPYPAAIHSFVYPCSPDLVRSIGEPYDFLRTLARNPDPAVPVDELLVAVLQQIYRSHVHELDGSQALIRAGRVLARLINDDHERLNSILRRVA